MDQLRAATGGQLLDKKAQKAKVTLALSGGVNSLIAAYLLKIQKYELTAITVMNAWEEYPGDNSKILSCHLNQEKADQIKSFCQKLGIPHRFIKAQAEFKERVVEKWVGSKILGQIQNQCWSCHDLRMELLYQGMQEDGASALATGHMSKLISNDKNDSILVHTSNDEQGDQSMLLSRLPRHILKSLLLPLSDLTSKELLKLSENFGLPINKTGLKMHDCFPWSEEIRKLLESKVPKKFLKEGEIVNSEEGQRYGPHEGIHNFTYGKELQFRDNSKQVKKIIKEYNYQEKKIVVGDESHFLRRNISLINCHFSEELSWPGPKKGILYGQNKQEIECWVYPKTLSSVYLELPSEEKFLEGEILSVKSKRGKNSKIYLSGEVQKLRPLNDEEESKTAKVNYAIDY